MADPASHPSLPADPRPHPVPTSTRGLPVQDVTTPDGAAARIGRLLQRNPEMDPGRPDSLKREAEPPETPDEPEFEQEPEQELPAQEPEGEELPAQDARTESESPDAEADAEAVTLDAEQLSELLGTKIDVDDDGGLRLKTNVGGEEGTATLQDLLKGYQTDAYLTKRGQAVADKERTVDARVTSLDEAIQGNHRALAALFNAAKDAINPYAGINWQQLEAESEAAGDNRFLTMKTKAHEWEQRLAGAVNQAQQQWEQDQRQLQTERGTTASARVTEQLGALQKALPDWGKEMQKDVEDYARTNYGMSEDDLQGISYHHGGAVMAYKAMMYDRGQQKIEPKKLQKIPKVMKPGARRSGAQQGAQEIATARAQLKKTGDPEAFVRLMKARTAHQRKR